MDYPLHLLILVGIYAMTATALNLTFGLAGLFNIAHVAIFSLGAYGTAVLAVDFGWPLAAALAAGTALAFVASAPLGIIANRIKNPDQFAIATLAFHEVVHAVALNWSAVTRGPLGIPSVPRPSFFGIDFFSQWAMLGWVTAIAAVVCGGYFWIFKGAVGRGLSAVRESEIFAGGVGIAPNRARMRAFFLGAIGAGFAGGIFAAYLNFVDPSSFLLGELIFVITILIVGRPGSFWGVIAACFLLVGLPEPLRLLDLPSDIVGPARQFLYAVVLFLIIFFRRKKIFPAIREV